MIKGVSIIVPNKYDDLWKTFNENLAKVAPGTPYQLIRVDGSGEDFSYSKACNTGLSEAIHDYVCFMNDDVYPKTNFWLYKLVSTLEKYNLSGVNPLQKLGDVWELPKKPPVPLVFVGRDFSHQTLSGFCLLTKKEYIIAVGGWDEKYEHYYEDTDMSLMLQKFGFQAYVGDVLSHHVEKCSSSRNKGTYDKKIEVSKAYFKAKWKSELA